MSLPPGGGNVGAAAASAAPSSGTVASVDPREGSRETHEGIIICEAWDWCKSNDPPVPYPITAKQIQAADLANTVRQTDDRSHVRGSMVDTCEGDEGGTGGGIHSGTHNGACWPKTWSETVRFESRNAVRHDDEWWMNNGNTWGRLQYIKDTGSYPTKEPKSIKPALTQVAYNNAGGTASDAPTPGASTSDQQAFFRPMAPVIRPMTPLRPPMPLPMPTPQTPPRTEPGDNIPGGNPQPQLGPKPDIPEQKLDDKMRPILKPDPQPQRQPKDDGTRTTQQCYGRIICFNRRGFDSKEYERQLELQQNAINAKSPDANVRDIDSYAGGNDGLRSLSGPLQDQLRSDYINQYKSSYISQYGADAWNQHISGLNAIHRLDMAAGGNPADFAGMGRGNINQYIGGEWARKEFPSTDERRYELHNYAKAMAEKEVPYGCDSQHLRRRVCPEQRTASCLK